MITENQIINQNEREEIKISKYYKTLQVNKKQVRLHRYLMGKKLGRRLNKGEVVHHKDGNKHNNDISNLELTTRKLHGCLHKPKKGKVYICSSCGMKMYRPKCYEAIYSKDYKCINCCLRNREFVCKVCGEKFIGYANKKYCNNCKKIVDKKKGEKWRLNHKKK